MGQIFTWDAIVRRQIPEHKDFVSVLTDLKQSLEKESSVVGAVVCGSVTRSDADLRSDLDCFLLYDAERERDAFVCMQKAALRAHKKHVPLVFIPCDTIIAGTNLHHVGESFRRHLERSVLAGGTIKDNPLQYVAPGVSEKEEFEGYLRVKLYTMQEAWGVVRTFSEERKAAHLKKVFEAPIHIARKMLAYMGELKDDSKATVRTRYMELMPQNLAEVLRHLVRINNEYTTELKRQVQHPHEARYAAMLSNMLVETETLIHFLRLNLLHLGKTARP